MKSLNQKIKIRQIDHSKIKNGQSVYKEKFFDADGKCLGPVPYIKKEFPIIELKILPNNFEKALNSGDKTVAESYRKWREKDFPDWFTMEEIEQEWRKSQPKYFGGELLKIFPEAMPYVRQRLKSLNERKDKLKQQILGDLKGIYRYKNKFDVWFFEKVIEIFKGEELERMDEETKKLKCFLYQRKTPKGRITEEQIQKAKEYPFENLIEVSRNHFALCPFHSEKNASFHIKNNRGHCFGCNWHGDTIKFLMDRDNLSFKEAVEFLQ